MNVTHRPIATAALVLLCLCGTRAVASSLYSETVLGDNPVAYWRLDELTGPTVYDPAGAHDATLSGAMTLGAPGALLGDSDPAIEFTGGYAWTPYASDLDGNTFSIECWARADLLDVAWRTPMMYRWVDPATAPSYKCYGYNLYKDQTNDNWEFWIGRGPTSAGFAVLNGPQVVIGDWTHLVGTYDGTTMRFYMDGSLVGSSVEPHGVLPSGAASFLIATGASRWMGGLDEMAVYNYALSPEQVAAHYAARVPEPSTALLSALALLGVAVCARGRRKRAT